MVILAVVVAGAVWVFNRDLVIADAVWRVVGVGLWIAGPVIVGAAVGAAAYGSTEQRSFPRTAIGTAVAVAIGVALIGIRASGFAFGALAAGWAVAIPSDKLWRMAARGLPAVVAAVLLAGVSLGRLEDAGTWPLVGVLGVSPLLAGLAVWLGDAVWQALTRRRTEILEPAPRRDG